MKNVPSFGKHVFQCKQGGPL